MRNKAIEPLRDKRLKVDWILFINDVQITGKLLHDLVKTPVKNADMVCGVDWDQGFYDIWVARDLDGKQVSF